MRKPLIYWCTMSLFNGLMWDALSDTLSGYDMVSDLFRVFSWVFFMLAAVIYFNMHSQHDETVSEIEKKDRIIETAKAPLLRFSRYTAGKDQTSEEFEETGCNCARYHSEMALKKIKEIERST